MWLYIYGHPSNAQSGNSPLHVVAGKGNFEALRVFLKNVQLPHINCTNTVCCNLWCWGNPRGLPSLLFWRQNVCFSCFWRVTVSSWDLLAEGSLLLWSVSYNTMLTQTSPTRHALHVYWRIYTKPKYYTDSFTLGLLLSPFCMFSHLATHFLTLSKHVQSAGPFKLSSYTPFSRLGGLP